jgi:hypothetical protein
MDFAPLRAEGLVNREPEVAGSVTPRDLLAGSILVIPPFLKSR